MSAKRKNPGPASIFSPKLAARFDALVTKYPVKRSALIPMLLYAQDEIGQLSDAVVAEVARRIGITELEVRNVATYYSMLRFKPAGKYNIQVCTNISCMLRGAYDVYERFREELGVDHKGVTADGLFSLEEVECIGACCWAPAIQVNYDFHDELKPDLVPGILSGYRGQAASPASGGAASSQPSKAKSKARRSGPTAGPTKEHVQDEEKNA
jgi:NADH-quinone oxidoreductase subunit E